MNLQPYERALLELSAQRDDLLVLTAENRAPIRGLPTLLGERFLDVGIAEQTLVGVAAGLALCGRRPVAHALASFLTMRAFEFVRTDVGLPGLPVILVGYVPGVLSEANGPTHQAIEDVALMRSIPGLEIFCPADQDELAEAVPALVERGRPTYVRYVATRTGQSFGPFVAGQAETLTPGVGLVTILTYGALVSEALEAARRLEAAGHPTEVVHLRSLWPVDERALLTAAEAELVVTLEDHLLQGGLRTLLAETLLRHGRSARCFSLGLPGYFRPALLADVLDQEGLSGERVAERVLQALEPQAALPASAPVRAARGARTWPIE